MSWHLGHQRVPTPYFSEDPSPPENLFDISVTPHQYTTLTHMMVLSHTLDPRVESLRVPEVEEEPVVSRFKFFLVFTGKLIFAR